MDDHDAMRQFTDSVAPLFAAFGDRLTLARDRHYVQWSFEGHAAIVEFQPGDRLSATFIAPPVLDAVSSQRVSAVYRPQRSAYRLTADGSERMVADMLAFFSGVREPRFSFVSAYAR